MGSGPDRSAPLPGISGRDRMDAVYDDWRRELPELDRPEFELSKRATRFGQLMVEALSNCLAPWSLTNAEFNVLLILRTTGASHELRPTDIRNRLLLTSGGTSNVLNRLERMGLAERTPDPSDGRGSWVRLTAAGAEVAEDTIRAWAAAQERMFSGVDPELARQTADGLRTIMLAMGDQEPAPAQARVPDSSSR